MRNDSDIGLINKYISKIKYKRYVLLIDESDKKGWYEKMKFFADNPNAVKDMGMALNELVLEKYTLQVVNKKRAEFLKSIVK